MSIHSKLIEVQNALKAPKSRKNSFANYAYRNCEDILEAVKPLLKEHGLTLFIGDTILKIGERFYVQATATVTDGEQHIAVSALARELEEKKGSDASQITGAASSYARKYALNGLFLIDDTVDADGQDNREQPKKAEPKPAPQVPEATPDQLAKIGELCRSLNMSVVEEIYKPMNITKPTGPQATAIIKRLQKKLEEAMEADSRANS